MVKKKENWFKPSKDTGWTKDDPETKRRRIALKSHKGDYLATARALQALANVTQDKETERKASKDAQYFFRMHRQSKRKGR